MSNPTNPPPFTRNFPASKRKLSGRLKIYMQGSQLIIDKQSFSLEDVRGILWRPAPKANSEEKKKIGLLQKIWAGIVLVGYIFIMILTIFDDTSSFSSGETEPRQLVLVKAASEIVAFETKYGKELEKVVEKINLILAGTPAIPA